MTRPPAATYRRGMLGLALGLLALSMPVLAEDAPACEQTTSVADFLGAAQRGERAFAAMDLPDLSLAREQALAVIPCLGQPIQPRDAAAFHRMMALAAFAGGDSEAVMREFHAARRLEPGYQIPASVAPPGHSLVRLYDLSVNADEGELQPTIPPRKGWVGVDGIRGAPRPDGISSVVQVFGEGDLLEQSLYVLPGEPVPAFGPLPIDDLRRKRRRSGLLIGSGSAFVTSSVLYGFAMHYKAQFWAYHPDPADKLGDDELSDLKLRTNVLGFTSLGAVVLSAGLGVTAAATW